MPKLVSVGTLVTRYSIVEDDSVLSMLSASLDAATLHLSEVLRTSFDQVTGQTDLFQFAVPSSPYEDDLNFFFQTSQGLLSAATPVVKAGYYKTDIASADEIDIEYWVMDKDLGLLSLNRRFMSEYVLGVGIATLGRQEPLLQVQYDAGYATTSDQYGDNYVGVPAWLTEAATLYGYELYKGGGGCVSHDLKRCSLAMKFMQKRIRLMPYAKTPF